MATNTHVGTSPGMLFVAAEVMQQPTPRKATGKVKAPVRFEWETTNLVFEIHPDGTAGGKKIKVLSDEHAERMAAEYLAIARRKVEFYEQWLKARKAGKTRPWTPQV